VGQVSDYAYLNARVSALARHLLSHAQFEQLVSAPGEGRSGALHTGGLDFLAELQPTPEVLEQRLITVLLADIMVLLRPLSGPPRTLLLYWMRRFELANLKLIIRGRLSNEDRATIRARLVDLGRFAILPIEPLLRTEDTAELLRVLERTPYVHIAREAFRIYSERRDLFALDATLEQRYFTGLATHLKALAGAERARLAPLVGGVIDRMNLTWLLRYRFAYALAPAEAYYLLISGGYELDSARLRALAQLGSLDEVLHGLPGSLAAQMRDARTRAEVERRLDAHTLAVARRLLARTTFNLARAVAYLHLREKQLLRIHGILKGLGLGLAQDIIREAAGLGGADQGVAHV
jgi:V/A-type H+-transporting ATPase subunit C